MNAWPNLDAALQGDHKAAAMAFVQYTFAFIVAISPVASAHEKGGQAAVLVFMLAVLPGKAKTIPHLTLRRSENFFAKAKSKPQN